MISRTRQTIVHFSSKFVLSGVDAPQPAGKYRVDHDEEAIETASHLGWRRVNSFMHLPAIAESGADAPNGADHPFRNGCAAGTRVGAIMTAPGNLRRSAHQNRRDASAHIFEVGQTVRIKGGFGTPALSAESYNITGTLPPRSDSPQYRIRNEDERHERVVTQDSLELVPKSPSEDGTSLMERTFGHGQGTETQQPRDQKAKAEKDSSKD